MRNVQLWAVTSAILAGCGHDVKGPAAPVEAQAPIASPVEAQAPIASPVTTNPEAPRGKRAPCTTDQSCNGDASVSALGGHCVVERGVCECNPGFELHPSGFCQKTK